jgi:hypothetical protein
MSVDVEAIPSASQPTNSQTGKHAPTEVAGRTLKIRMNRKRGQTLDKYGGLGL